VLQIERVGKAGTTENLDFVRNDAFGGGGEQDGPWRERRWHGLATLVCLSPLVQHWGGAGLAFVEGLARSAGLALGAG
jgi:hypothetical protein